MRSRRDGSLQSRQGGVIAARSQLWHSVIMNKIDKDELFTQVNRFLKAKGIDLQEGGSYTRTVEKGCQLLADTINLSQQAVERAKAEIDKTVEHARDVIHQKTAPGKPPMPAKAEVAPPPRVKPPRIPGPKPTRPRRKRRE